MAKTLKSQEKELKAIKKTSTNRVSKKKPNAKKVKASPVPQTASIPVTSSVNVQERPEPPFNYSVHVKNAQVLVNVTLHKVPPSKIDISQTTSTELVVDCAKNTKKFLLRFPLPFKIHIDPESAQYEFENGILSCILPIQGAVPEEAVKERENFIAKVTKDKKLRFRRTSEGEVVVRERRTRIPQQDSAASAMSSVTEHAAHTDEPVKTVIKKAGGKTAVDTVLDDDRMFEMAKKMEGKVGREKALKEREAHEREAKIAQRKTRVEGKKEAKKEKVERVFSRVISEQKKKLEERLAMNLFRPAKKETGKKLMRPIRKLVRQRVEPSSSLVDGIPPSFSMNAEVLLESSRDSGSEDVNEAIRAVQSRVGPPLDSLMGLVGDDFEEGAGFIGFKRGKKDGYTSSVTSSSTTGSSGSSVETDLSTDEKSEERSAFGDEATDEIPEAAVMRSSTDSDSEGGDEQLSEIASPSSFLQQRAREFGTTFEERAPLDPREAHLTLVFMHDALTVQGPCCLCKLSGDICLNGFPLDSEPVELSKDQRVCMASIRGLKRRKKKKDGVAQNGKGGVVAFNSTGSAGQGTHGANDDDEIKSQAKKYGHINWGWVQGRLEAWALRLGTRASVVLFATHKDLPRMKWRPKKGSNEIQSWPGFISRFREVRVNNELLKIVMQATPRRGCAVAVVGEPGIGKSTLCRHAANAFIARHGHCYWADFDLGQPEFTPPGVFSISEVKSVMFRPGAYASGIRNSDEKDSDVNVLHQYYLGTFSVRCPIVASRAIEALCATILAKRLFPLVINTHGLVFSTGRRATLEIFSRLHPQFIISLHRRNSEADWCRACAINDKTQGLNRDIVGRGFIDEELSRLLPERPERGEGRHFSAPVVNLQLVANSTPNTITGTKRGRTSTRAADDQSGGESDLENEYQDRSPVADKGGRKATIYDVTVNYGLKQQSEKFLLRRRRWNAYFSPLFAQDAGIKPGGFGALARQNGGRLKGYCVIRVDWSAVEQIMLVADESCAALTSKNALHCVLRNRVVALCKIDNPSQNSGNATPSVTLLAKCVPPPEISCFAVVLSITDDNVVLAIPRQATFVDELFGSKEDGAESKSSNVVLIISPEMWNDQLPVVKKTLSKFLTA